MVSLQKKRETLNARVRNIDSQIDMAQRRVDAYRERLVTQFTMMEQKIMMLNNQMGVMASQVNSWWAS